VKPHPKQGMLEKKLKKPLKRSPIKKKRKVTGEKALFQSIAMHLDGHSRCFVCNIKIPLLTHHNFAHVLPKGKYPSLRLEKENIAILCYNYDGSGCHSKWDFSPRSELKKDSGFDKMFDLERNLKEKISLQNL
jgi:hypothetical protein